MTFKVTDKKIYYSPDWKGIGRVWFRRLLTSSYQPLIFLPAEVGTTLCLLVACNIFKTELDNTYLVSS
jgi:hypothetical protein